MEGERRSYHQEGANPLAGDAALSSATPSAKRTAGAELDVPELHGIPGRGKGTGQQGHGQCSSLRDQHNLNSTRRKETPGQSRMLLFSTDRAWFRFGDFFPFCSFCLISPLSSIPRSSGLETTASTTLPTTTAITWRCCQMPLGLQPKGKRGLSKANCFIC